MARFDKLLHKAEVVRHEKDRDLPLPQLFEFADAAVRKNRIAHRKGLIHDQNIRIDVNGGGESQPDIHAARILFHWPVDEVADLGERLNQRQVALHLGAADAHDLAVDENVFAAGELRIETRAQFEQRGHSSTRDDAACRRLEDPADHLKQGALAAAVRTHQTDDFAALDAERDVPQCPEIGVQRLVTQRIQFADAVERRLIQPVEL